MILRFPRSFCLLAPLSAGLVGVLLAAPPVDRGERIVFLGSDLSLEQQLVFTSAFAAAEHPGVLLFDSSKHDKHVKAFLDAFQPEQVIPVGAFTDGVADLQGRLGTRTGSALLWRRGPPIALWKQLLPRAETVVICPAEPRERLLQAACLAGVLRAPLLVLHDQPRDAEEMREVLDTCRPMRAYLIGAVEKVTSNPFPKEIIRLDSAEAVAARHRELLRQQGPIQTLVIANPADGKDGMSALAPWIAVRKRAALLLTHPSGDNVDELVHAALRGPELRQAETLLLVAGLKAIPMPRRPNPIPGDKDEFIEMEPLTPRGTEPFSFATGRLFHDDPAVVALMLARPRLLPPAGSPRKALVASNPGNSLSLLETVSRNTALELRNAGYQTTVLLGHDLTKDELRSRLPDFDLFLWEGHHNTLIKEWKMPDWNEPLRPSLVFLQSCLALEDWKAQPLLQRGAYAVVGSSTRTYSASGGACSLAFFDALLYEDQTLGGALRQAKNFLLAYAQLKEERLGIDAKRTGANQRAAWAFTLWGDPTLKLPAPKPPATALPAVRHEVRGNVITLSLPEQAYPRVATTKYHVQMRPNERLAGLLTKPDGEDGKPLVPLVFAEVRLPRGPAGQQPRLSSRLPSSRWVFCWDARRGSGYLLALPRSTDREELRFTVHWQPAEAGERKVGVGERR